MKPLPNKVIIKAQYDQKEYIVYGKLRLVLPNRDKYVEDGRVGNPVLAEVIAVHPDTKYLHEGDKVVLHHNSIKNDSWMMEMDKEEHTVTLAIPTNNLILGKLNAEGNLLPLFDNLVVERIDAPSVSSFIIMPDAYKKPEQHKVKVLQVCDNEEKIHPGQTAFIHTNANYECFYQHNGEDRSAVVVKREEVLGTMSYK